MFPRLIAAEHRQHGQHRQLETVSSGISELDTMLGGGIDRGTATLFLGPTGTGKSTLITQCVVAAARRGEKSAMYVFDERTQSLFQRAAGLGLELEEHVEAGLITVRQGPDIALCDLGLPGMSGYELARTVRADETLREIPLVAVTGYGQPEDRKRTAEAGFDEHLTKPVEVDALNAVLHRLCDEPISG